MTETYAQRKTREARRDRIRALALECAQHTAIGDLNSVESVVREREGYRFPALQFAHPVRGHRCECGAQMAPVPQFLVRWGWGPTWFCSFCNLEGLIEACVAIKTKVEAE